MCSRLLSQNSALGVKVGLRDAVFYGFPCKLRPKPKIASPSTANSIHFPSRRDLGTRPKSKWKSGDQLQYAIVYGSVSTQQKCAAVSVSGEKTGVVRDRGKLVFCIVAGLQRGDM